MGVRVNAFLPPVARHVRRRRRHAVIRVVALVLVAGLGYQVVLASAVAGRLDSALAGNASEIDSLVGDRPQRVTPTAAAGGPADPGAGAALNVLLIGSDSRSPENAAIGGGAGLEGMRSDATVLLHISANRSRVDAISLPRDAQVTIPDCTHRDGSITPGGYGDLNVAFANGGSQGDVGEAAACTIRTVEELTDVRIDHYAVADFEGFAAMVDAVGGVPMCIPTRIVSAKSDLVLKAGPRVLDGSTALKYARLRTAEEGGVSGSDLQRITRQQQLLSQLARVVTSQNLLTDVAPLTRFLRATAEALTMDPVMADTTFLLGLAYSLRSVGVDGITFATVPWEYTEDFLNVALRPEAAQMWDDVRNDRPLSVTAEGDASSAWDDGLREDTSSPAAQDPSSPDDAATGEPEPEDTSTEDLLALCR